jgi:hypothetical protein
LAAKASYWYSLNYSCLYTDGSYKTTRQVFEQIEDMKIKCVSQLWFILGVPFSLVLILVKICILLLLRSIRWSFRKFESITGIWLSKLLSITNDSKESNWSLNISLVNGSVNKGNNKNLRSNKIHILTQVEIEDIENLNKKINSRKLHLFLNGSPILCNCKLLSITNDSKESNWSLNISLVNGSVNLLLDNSIYCNDLKPRKKAPC